MIPANLLCWTSASVLAALAAFSAEAGTTQTIGSGPARVEIAAGEAGTLVVTYANRLVSSLTVELWTVDLDGTAVSGVIEARPDDDPDDMIVTPPVGWMCDPCVVTVEEGESGTVELYPMVGA